jgi:hypothetical protein
MHDLLELVHARAGGRRTKTAAAKIPLSEVGWTALHAAASSACKEALENAVVFAHLLIERGSVSKLTRRICFVRP